MLNPTNNFGYNQQVTANPTAAPATPVIQNPQDDGTVLYSPAPQIRWTRVRGATSYVVNVYDYTSGSAIPFEDSEVKGTSYQSQDLVPGNVYSITVQSKNAIGISDPDQIYVNAIVLDPLAVTVLPEYTQVNGYYQNAIKVHLEGQSYGCPLVYTVNGVEPDAGAVGANIITCTEYEAPSADIDVDGNNCTVKVKAFKQISTGYNYSGEKDSGALTFKCITPEVSDKSGTYNEDVIYSSTDISTGTLGADVLVSTDDGSNYVTYTGTLTVNITGSIVKAKATKYGYTDSDVSTGQEIILKAYDPVFSPPSHELTDGSTIYYNDIITNASAQQGSTIAEDVYYDVGNDPTNGSSQVDPMTGGTFQPIPDYVGADLRLISYRPTDGNGSSYIPSDVVDCDYHFRCSPPNCSGGSGGTSGNHGHVTYDNPQIVYFTIGSGATAAAIMVNGNPYNSGGYLSPDTGTQFEYYSTRSLFEDSEHLFMDYDFQCGTPTANPERPDGQYPTSFQLYLQTTTNAGNVIIYYNIGAGDTQYDSGTGITMGGEFGATQVSAYATTDYPGIGSGSTYNGSFSFGITETPYMVSPSSGSVIYNDGATNVDVYFTSGSTDNAYIYYNSRLGGGTFDDPTNASTLYPNTINVTPTNTQYDGLVQYKLIGYGLDNYTHGSVSSEQTVEFKVQTPTSSDVDLTGVILTITPPSLTGCFAVYTLDEGAGIPDPQIDIDGNVMVGAEYVGPVHVNPLHPYFKVMYCAPGWSSSAPYGNF